MGPLPAGYKSFEEYDTAIRKEWAEGDRGIHRRGLQLLGRDPWRPNDGVAYIDGRDKGTFTYATWIPTQIPRCKSASEEEMRGTLALRFNEVDFTKLSDDLSRLVFPRPASVRVRTERKELGEGIIVGGGSALFRGVDRIVRMPSKFGITFDYVGTQFNGQEVSLTVGDMRTSEFSEERVRTARKNELAMNPHLYCEGHGFS